MQRSCLSTHALVTLLAVTLLTVTLAPSTQAQEAVIGYFDGQHLNDTQVSTGNGGTGAMTLLGWALADSGVRQVLIQVDGQDAGAAILGRSRPTVERLYPDFPDSSAAGFAYRLNSTRYLNGLHTVSVKVISNDGTITTLPPARDFLINNNTTLLKPFGRINDPNRNAHVYGYCDITEPRRRLVEIEGWALDLGVETNDAGIGYVELMIDNQIIANTRAGCRFILNEGGFTNCYGLPRPEIERNYPFARDAPNAGFRFVLDIGTLIDFGYSEGQHLLTIRAGDTSNQIADIDEIPVVFRCIEGLPNEGAFGRIESPRTGRQYSGDLRIQGWLIDPEGVDDVLVHIDGQFVGLAAYGAEDGIFETRPGVFSQYPGYPGVEAPVFRLSPNFDTNELSDGGHQIQIYVLDREGDTTLVGENSFFVDNRNDG